MASLAMPLLSFFILALSASTQRIDSSCVKDLSEPTSLMQVSTNLKSVSPTETLQKMSSKSRVAADQVMHDDESQSKARAPAPLAGNTVLAVATEKSSFEQVWRAVMHAKEEYFQQAAAESHVHPEFRAAKLAGALAAVALLVLMCCGQCMCKAARPQRTRRARTRREILSEVYSYSVRRDSRDRTITVR